MSDIWHPQPRDGAWRQVHLAHVESLGKKLWLQCVCGHASEPLPRAFAEQHALPMSTPLLSIARRLRCTRCGERKAHCRPEPYRTPR
jgi:hypothetical protein